jgi:hypothetical protein
MRPPVDACLTSQSATASRRLAYRIHKVERVTLTTPEGTSVATLAAQFSYVNPLVPRPTLSSISPTEGLGARGISVTITDTHFIGATTVRFGWTNATSVAINSDRSILAVSSFGWGARSASGIGALTVSSPQEPL